MAKRRREEKAPGALPSREEIRRFIRNAPGRVGKREIAREFGLGPEHRVALRGILKSLEHEGDVAPAGHRRFTEPGRSPEATIVQVTGTDPDGDAIARPVAWEGDGPPPMVLMAPEARGRPALAPGERVLARLRPIGNGRYQGRTLKRITEAPGRVLGVYRPAPQGGGRLVPTDRRAKAEWRIPPGEEGEAEAGEIVLAEPLGHAGIGLKPARIVERLGRMGDARSVSLICIVSAGIPQEFPEPALAEAKRARGVPLGKREDLREIPLVTIDGEDARDFDDAVFAEPDGPDGEGGWRLVVAIADVAHYVRPGSALDRAAWERGNSCYFPDRVVPMLPEALSNGWCSLRPGEDRGCLFAEMWIDKEGRKTRHRFGRGLMRSAARLTYTEVQEAEDASGDVGLQGGGLRHLYPAFRALLSAREKRGTLDLDLPERRVVLDDRGHVLSVAPRPRLDSHRLIEEFMVLANVAAAEELERLRQPCMYRVHAPPSEEKLEGLREFLRGLDINLPPGNQLHPRDFDRVLARVRDTEHQLLVNEMVLRTQSQAQYNPDNIGHFGLALPRYAHFTSPIRRYSDLCVHRALIRGLKLGLGGLEEEEAARFPDTAEHISATERRAALAERDAIDRYLAAFMADKVGATFTARVSGVTRFGLFVTIPASGASGLVPVSTLPDDFWMHDERAQTLTGRRSRLSFRLAEEVEVRLAEASPVTGGLIFHIMTGPAPQGTAPRGAADPGGGESGRAGFARVGERAVQAWPAIRAALVLLLLIAAPAAAQTSGPPASGLETAPIAHVLAAALGFMAPRILDPVPVPQLTVWGLHGVTALDPALTAELRDGSLRLAAPDRILFAQAPPPIADPDAWAAAASAMMQAAWTASPAIRRAGAPGLVQSFFDELFNHLDPYSRYVAPLQAVADREHRSGDAGIGAVLARRGNTIVVQSVLADGPAAEAGIRPGEQIVSIDGDSIAGLELDEVNERIAGPDGSPVTVGLRRVVGRRALARTLELARATMPPETVFASRVGDLLLIRVTSFAADTADRILRELRVGIARNPKGIVLDLRGNRGGLLRQSVDAAGAVLDNAIVSVTLGRDPEADHIFRAQGPDMTNGLPIVLLVDGRSASAAEIMAAALIDQRRAVAVGSATLGKGLVQTIAPMPDGGELFVTWSRVLAPLGWPLQGLGVLPQLCTSLGQETTARELADLVEGRLDMADALARHNAARAPLPAPAIIELRNACPAAEGRNSDFDTARFLLDHPDAYAAALLPAAAGPNPPALTALKP